MFIIYDLIFLFFVIFSLPVYILRRKCHKGLWLRLGILPKYLLSDNPIWIHAVSVGEVMAIRLLYQRLRQVYQRYPLIISTVTSTGNEVAKRILDKKDSAIYLPFDFSFVVKSVVDKIKPSLFIITETEIWPNLLHYLYRKNIPVILVNGRISDKSFKWYLSVRFLLKSTLAKIRLFCVQTVSDAERFKRLGVYEDRIYITGNMKFDTAATPALSQDPQVYRTNLGIQPQDKVFVAGSTHPGEEEIIFRVYRELLRDFAELKLIIAPRHPQRAGQIQRIATKFGLSSILISQLNQPPLNLQEGGLPQIYILDVIGQLLHYYAIADVVFIGGSLARKGGHNLLEPASLGKPVLFGPHMFNFKDIANLFLKSKAAILVHNQTELRQHIADLLKDPHKREVLAKRAEVLIRQNQGATARNLELIKLFLS
ncbi:MAG: 3-deoxy-D-manno-octulosonic acid transferase [Candidatus Omnitrophica bacterium]|nr:3-deoxy-D-manno-octulosonic acid transferase [Candidatus Omnitrophota bacterium]